MNGKVFEETIIGFFAGAIAQIISGIAIGLLIAFIFWGNEEIRLSGGYMAIFWVFLVPIPRALCVLLVAIACAIIAPTVQKAILGSLLINSGVALIFGLYAMGVLGKPLGV